MGKTSVSTSLMPRLVQAVILPQHGVFAGLKRFGWTFWESAAFHQQAYKFDVMRLWDSKGSVNLLRINCVLPTSLHTLRDVFVGLKRFGWTFWGLAAFYQQTYTLSSSLLPYHFVGFSPHSTSPIPQGTFSTFGLTLSHGQIIYFYFATI